MILGLLARLGPHTAYDLKQFADGSIGFFWEFPQSQLYAESGRLEELGLITSTQEAGGRRRRILAITAEGRVELQQWLADPASGPTQIRDLGLLQLFFSDVTDRRTRRRLASAQLQAHQEMLHTYEAIAQEWGPGRPDTGRMTLEMGLAYERAAIAFWTTVLAEFG